MTITFQGKINTEENEETIFNVIKKFMIEHFQDYEFKVIGKDKTFTDKWEKPKEPNPIEEIIKKVKDKDSQVVLG